MSPPAAPPARSAPPADPPPPSSQGDEFIESPLALFDHLRGTDQPEAIEGDAEHDDADGQDEDDEDGDDEAEDGDELGDAGDDDGDVRVVPLPCLNEDVLLDEDALDLVLADVVGVSSAARDMEAEIEQLHDVLHERLTPTAFEILVRLEMLYQARLVVLLPVIAAWAWSEGRACREEEVQ